MTPEPSSPATMPTADAPEPLASPTVLAEDSLEVILAHGGKERRPRTEVQPFDSRHSSVLSPGELRRLRLRYDQFLRALAGRFSILLRVDLGLTNGRVRTLSYQRLLEELGGPAHITVFRTDPLKGAGLLVIPPRLGLLIVDRLLGGPGRPAANPGELTEIEVALLDQVVQLTLSEWCAQWKDLCELRPVTIGQECQARFLQTASAETPMVLLSAETSMAESSDVLHLALPCAMLDPLLRRLSQAVPAAKEPATAPAARPLWSGQFGDLELPVRATWTGLRVSAREIGDLKRGDVLLLQRGNTGEVQLQLARQPKFTGRLGTRGPHWAVQVTGPILPDSLS